MNPLKFISKLFKSKTSPVEKSDINDDEKKQNWDIKFNDLGIFTYNALGFDIDLDEGFHSIRWADIERLQAYKADLITTDEICIDIIFDYKIVTVTEDTKGWYQFIGKLKSTLPLTYNNWEALVLKSPFEYDLITIYERPDRKIPYQ